MEEFYVAVGKLLQNASTTEIFLAKAFEVLAGCSAKVSAAIFYSFDSLNGKANLLRRLVKVSGSKDDSRIIEQLINAAEKSNKQRNTVAHALLLFDSPDLASKMTKINLKSARTEEVSKAALDTSLKISGDAVSAGKEALELFCLRHEKSPLLDFTEFDDNESDQMARLKGALAAHPRGS